MSNYLPLKFGIIQKQVTKNVEIKGKNLIRNLLTKTSLIALLPAITLSLNVNAANNYENTWFEIEVILFSQIDDKSRLQEAFPESSELPKPTTVLDLLGPYLASDISTLKNRLPSCEGFINTPPSPFISAIALLFNIQRLKNK